MNIKTLLVVSLLTGCAGAEFTGSVPKMPEKNREFTPDTSAEDATAEEATVEEATVPICGGASDSCYTNQAALTARNAVTPLGKKLTLIQTSAKADIWVEKDGTKVLKADGFDNWQMKLNIDGKGFSVDYFTSPATLAGRVCPPNVYIDDANKFATNSCMYYDDAKTPEADLNAAGSSQTNLGAIGLGVWSDYTGTVARWYTGNIEPCAVKGMRLPTIFETSIKKPIDPAAANFPIADGTPVWAETLGIPNVGNYKWTATAAKDNTGYYVTWMENIFVNQHITFEKSARCVLP